MIVATAHQPAFLPWLGLIHKIIMSDIFIFMDIAKFRKRAFMHRNKIEINKTSHFLGLKIDDNSDRQYCHQIEISNFHKNNLDELSNKILINYKNYDFFKDLEQFIKNCFDKNLTKLNDLCIIQLQYLCNVLNIKTKIIKESDFLEFNETLKIDASERLFLHAKKNNADIYITGINSKEYLNAEIFSRNNILHYTQKFDYLYFKKYQTCEEPLSIIHQIAKLGFNNLKKELLKTQLSKNQLIQFINDRSRI